MSVIAPTILAEDEAAYQAAVEKIHPFAQRVHIDIADGKFAPTFTITADRVWWPKEWVVDIHAMVTRPDEYLETLISLKPYMIIFHVEVEIDLVPILQRIKASGIHAGVALLRSTVPATVSAAIQAADHVLIFSGDLGHYGGTANLMQLEKVRLIKAIKNDVEIGWDGGVSPENIFMLIQGGIDVLNVGGAIMKATDPQAAYVKLIENSKRHGII